MKKFAWIAALVILTVGGLSAQTDGTMMKSDKGTADGSMMKSSGDTMMKADSNTMMKSSNTMVVSDSQRKMSADPMDLSAFNLKGLGKQVVPFTTEAAAQALAKTQTVIYYFAATWCPDCQATYKDVQANFAKIPANVTLIYVNYDKSADLKKKYGITTQHSFVVIGPQGEKKTAWSGAATVAEILKNAKLM